MRPKKAILRGGSRIAATSKMEHFVVIVNDWKPLILVQFLNFHEALRKK